MKRGLVIPDLQAAPGRSNKHLLWAARFAVDKGFDPIIQIGDAGDFPSLSSYDKGKAEFEGRRLSRDWDAMRASIELFDEYLDKHKHGPRKVYTKGNHEFRIDRAKSDNPGVDTLPDVLGYMRSQGWESYEYLKVARVEGVLVSHLFPLTLTGKVSNTSVKYGAPNAAHQVRANMASTIAGHKPGYDVAMFPGPGGKTLCGLIAGSFYLHRESYNGGADYDRAWKGVVVLNRLHQGRFDAAPVSIEYLRERYGK